MFQRGPCCWGKWVILTQFRILHQQIEQACTFFNINFACRVHATISRQMKYESYGTFKSFFNLRVLYCTPNLFCPFLTICLMNYCCPEDISYLLIFFGFKSDMMSLQWEDKSDVYKFSKEGTCLWQIRCFNSVLDPTALSVYFQTFETWTLVLCLCGVKIQVHN